MTAKPKLTDANRALIKQAREAWSQSLDDAIVERIQKIPVGIRTGQCDCCGADNVELSFCVAYGIETWSCAEGCEAEPDPDKQDAEWANALINDPEAKAIVENWLSGFGEPPLGISQLQKDWLVIGIATALQGSKADALAACRALVAWDDAEKAGPDYGTLTRDTHPNGEAIWQRWWDDQNLLCDHAFRTARATIAKAEPRS